jgi:hypothetical protein
MADPIHFENLNSNISEVLRLVEIHTKMTGSGRGRRHNVAILNKSGIVLMVSFYSTSSGIPSAPDGGPRNTGHRSGERQ